MATIRSRTCLVAAVLVLVVLAGCSEARVDPTVCVSCETGITAADGNASVSVEESQLTIRVDERGDARWRVRSRLSGENVSRLRGDPDRVQRLAERVVSDGTSVEWVHYEPPHGGNVRNVSGRLEGRSLRISFTVPNAAQESVGGVLLVDQFHAKGGSPEGYSLGTDRVVLRGPPGTVVTHAPPGGSVVDGGRAVAWTRQDEVPYADSVSGEAYVAFAGDEGVGGQASTWVALVTDVAGWLLPQMGAAVFGNVMLGAVAVVLARPWKRRSERDAYVPPAVSERIRGALRSRTAAGTLVVGLAVLALILASGLDGEGVRSFVYWTFTVPIVPLVLFAVLGVDYALDRRWQGAILGAILLVPFATFAPLAASPEPANVGDFEVIEYYLSVFATLLVGPVLFLVASKAVGWAAGDRRPDRGDDSRR